jgi:diguanylate cyclase
MSAPDPQRPPDIAREALRRLALERVPPTPDNFRAFYHAIAGTPGEDPFPEKALRLVAGALPRGTPEGLRIARTFEDAVATRQWLAIRQAIVALCEVQAAGQPAWGLLVRDLITELERRHDGPVTGHKREALHQLLTATAPDSTQLFQRLHALVRSWASADPDLSAAGPAMPGTDPAPGALATSPAQASTTVAALLAHLLRRAIVPMIEDNPTLVREAASLARALGDDAPLPDLEARVHALAAQLEWIGEDQRAVRQALLGLLRLIIDNISELVIDDSWLHGQLAVLVEAFSGPLDIRILDEVERRLREVIDKQRHLKRQLTDAQTRLKAMLSGFVDRLAQFSTSTGAYHDVLERCAREIDAAHDISELGNVVEEMLRETRVAQQNALRSGEELTELRNEVESANNHIARLQRDLDETSELVRHDPLTGALNRRGLDEALTREIARARRRGADVCLALLDLDNFKNINDTYGHKTGDDALRHLVVVVRESLRPQDFVGRFGGEEFLIVLPDTALDQAIAIVTRLQRELTRRFFLADNQRLLITFSAGIALLAVDEDPYVAIDRADKAMYAAKRAGKNRVFLAN